MAVTSKSMVFDSSVLQYQKNIPKEFIWPEHEKPSPEDHVYPILEVPTIDLKSCLSGDTFAVSKACQSLNEACKKHGFFLVVNHGVDSKLIEKIENQIDLFFGMTLLEKQKAQRKLGDPYGYASSFTDRFTSRLPWKETLSLRYCSFDDEDFQSSLMVEDYIVNVLGEDKRKSGKILQEYCEAMNNLSLKIFELLGMSLGIGKFLREFYEKNDSVMRFNYYPICQNPDQALGTGPHSDPISLAILHQDHVGGLQVLVDKVWHSVPPVQGTFVINIGDTLKALTNGIYKSCLHRAVVNKKYVRKSIAYFLCPKKDVPVIPPNSLVNADNPRLYPDFNWSLFLEFTQKHYRSDLNTLDAFCNWVINNNQKL